MRPVAFDTNVLVYAAGFRRSEADERKIPMAEDLVRQALRNEIVVLPFQTCPELHNLLVRKAGHSRAEAERVVDAFAGSAMVIGSDVALMRVAFALAGAHRLQTFDAVILAAAASAGCELLYSEYMQHGFEWRGLMVVNPFA